MYENLKLENQLCFKIYSLSKSIIRVYVPLLKEIDLTYPQYLTMMVLWEHRNISFKDISYLLKMKTGTLTPILNKLESNGYLERIKDDKDDRKIYIAITKKGLELGEKANCIPKEILKNIDIDEDEYRKYIKEFSDLVNRLDCIEKYMK